MLSDVVNLVIPGVAGGLVLAAVLIRTMENVMGTPLTLGPTPLGIMEPLIYTVASTIAAGVALLASLSAAHCATSATRWWRCGRSERVVVLTRSP